MIKKFRLNNVNLFLTYPQCLVSKELARDQLLHSLRNQHIDRFAIAQEEHKDGGLHLHIILCAGPNHRFDIKSSDFLDLQLNGVRYHGKYEKCRSVKAAWKYISKEDKNPLHNFSQQEVDKLQEEKENMRTQVGKRMLQGDPLESLVEEYPNLIFGFKRLKEDFIAYKESLHVHINCPRWLPNTWGKLLPLRADGTKRRHFWIWSNQPNRGKTTFANKLRELYEIPIFSGDFTYWNVRGDEEVIILDEYNTASLRFAQLNSICDGTFGFRVFQRGVVQLPKLKMCIVLSNCQITDLYPFKYELLQARFKEIELV